MTTNETTQATAPISLDVMQELNELSRTITELRHEISKLQNKESHGFEFNAAQDELETVVNTTAQATNSILDQMELLEKFQNDFTKDVWMKAQEQITRVYEACSFQDITGQRLRKVMAIIKIIEFELGIIFKNHETLMGNATPSQNASDVSMIIIKELYALSVKIKETKTEMSLIQDNRFQFSSAHDELNEVSNAVLNATQTILSCAESLEGLGAQLAADKKPQFNDIITRIYEACTFQDLIGQRLSKVIKTLALIDQSLTRIFKDYKDLEPRKPVSDNETVVLENGPQLPKNAPTQHIIDDLFNKKN
jgi:chemotaxis protein CheZ